MKNKLTKCPVCNSSRITTNDNRSRCKKCGYIHSFQDDPLFNIYDSVTTNE